MKGAYIGVGGVRTLSQCYVGSGGVRKVKDIFIGINGAVKKVWSATVPAGQIVLTSSQVWTVPEGVKSIDVFCVGGGAAPFAESTGPAGSGGYTSTGKNMAVMPGQQIAVTVGVGGRKAITSEEAKVILKSQGITKPNYAQIGEYTNGTSGAISSFLTISAAGGIDGIAVTRKGGSGGGSGAYVNIDSIEGDTIIDAGNGGSDGSNGENKQGRGCGLGQGTTTRSFGEPGGTLYAGGGGGGGYLAGGNTGYGRVGVNAYGKDGGGDGGWRAPGGDATPNTGGGGGCQGTFENTQVSGWPTTRYAGGAGGSGVVIVRWAEQ